MSDFSGDQELLKEFLTEAGELLADVDNKLVELERRQDDPALLNHIFRGFHTIKGGAGFLCVQPLVDLCHLTENLFDLLRNGSLKLNPALMDVIMSATGSVRDMFDGLATSGHSGPADAELLADLERAISGEPLGGAAVAAPAAAPAAATPPSAPAAAMAAGTEGKAVDWPALYGALTGVPAPATVAEAAPAASAASAAPAAASTVARMIAICSSCVTVGDSPVVPTGTRPSIPARIWYSTSFLRSAKETWPLVKGVTSAVIVPVSKRGFMEEKWVGSKVALVETAGRFRDCERFF